LLRDDTIEWNAMDGMPAGAASWLNLYYEVPKYCRTVIPSGMSAVSLFPKTAAYLEGLLSRCMTSIDPGPSKK